MALPHDILGIAPSASFDELRTAYKRLAMKHHPDRGGDPVEFQRVQQAYDALKRKIESKGLFDDLFDHAAQNHRSSR